MIYIEKNKGLFTKSYKDKDIYRIVCTNQVTQTYVEIFTVAVEGGNGLFIQEITVEIPSGTYDYIAYSTDNEVIGTGILSNIGEATEDYIKAYSPSYSTMSYNPERPYVPSNMDLKITENGEYNVEIYDKVTVNVPSTKTVEITKTDYENLTEKDNNTIYLING